MAKPSRRKNEKKHAPAREEIVSLSDDWRCWVVENLLLGAPIDALRTELRAHGVPKKIARREIAALSRSEALVACARYRRRAERLELVTRLLSEHARSSAAPIELPRRTMPGAEELFERYYEANRPGLFTDASATWPALSKWTPEYLRSAFGDAEVEVSDGRAAEPHPDRDFHKLKATMTMRALVDRVLEAGVSNDIYLIANNHAMDQEPLAALLDDIVLDEEIFDPSRLKGGVSLWFGPAGTVTPLHHDVTNILFFQIFGRKQITLVPAFETELLQEADGFYAQISGREAASRFASAIRVELGPGDALFLPAGWWHEVSALDVSISFSLLNFRRPNAFDWYTPGRG